jgi:hypothetical protein
VNRTDTNRRSATGSDAAPPGLGPTGWAVAPGRALAASGVAHSEQNFAPGGLTVPQVGQPAASGVPHSTQNFAPARLSVAQVGQITRAMPQLSRRSDRAPA